MTKVADPSPCSLAQKQGNRNGWASADPQAEVSCGLCGEGGGVLLPPPHPPLPRSRLGQLQDFLLLPVSVRTGTQTHVV